MEPDKLRAGSGNGWMGDAEKHRRSSRDGLCTSVRAVRSRYLVRCSPAKRCLSAHTIFNITKTPVVTKCTSRL